MNNNQKQYKKTSIEYNLKPKSNQSSWNELMSEVSNIWDELEKIQDSKEEESWRDKAISSIEQLKDCYKNWFTSYAPIHNSVERYKEATRISDSLKLLKRYALYDLDYKIDIPNIQELLNTISLNYPIFLIGFRVKDDDRAENIKKILQEYNIRITFYSYKHADVIKGYFVNDTLSNDNLIIKKIFDEIAQLGVRVKIANNSNDEALEVFKYFNQQLIYTQSIDWKCHTTECTPNLNCEYTYNPEDELIQLLEESKLIEVTSNGKIQIKTISDILENPEFKKRVDIYDASERVELNNKRLEDIFYNNGGLRDSRTRMKNIYFIAIYCADIALLGAAERALHWLNQFLADIQIPSQDKGTINKVINSMDEASESIIDKWIETPINAVTIPFEITKQPSFKSIPEKYLIPALLIIFIRRVIVKSMDNR